MNIGPVDHARTTLGPLPERLLCRYDQVQFFDFFSFDDMILYFLQFLLACLTYLVYYIYQYKSRRKYDGQRAFT